MMRTVLAIRSPQNPPRVGSSSSSSSAPAPSIEWSAFMWWSNKPEPAGKEICSEKIRLIFCQNINCFQNESRVQFHQHAEAQLLHAQIPTTKKRQPSHHKKKIDRLVVLLYFSRFALYAVRSSLMKLTPGGNRLKEFLLKKTKLVLNHSALNCLK